MATAAQPRRQEGMRAQADGKLAKTTGPAILWSLYPSVIAAACHIAGITRL